MNENNLFKQRRLELLLVDPVGWEEEIEAVHLEILQEKLNNYIYFLESKQYVERYGDNFDKKVIHITFQYSPSDNGLAFLAAAQKVLQNTDMSLKIELPEWYEESERRSLFGLLQYGIIELDGTQTVIIKERDRAYVRYSYWCYY